MLPNSTIVQFSASRGANDRHLTMLIFVYYIATKIRNQIQKDILICNKDSIGVSINPKSLCDLGCSNGCSKSNYLRFCQFGVVNSQFYRFLSLFTSKEFFVAQMVCLIIC